MLDTKNNEIKIHTSIVSNIVLVLLRLVEDRDEEEEEELATM